MKRSRNPMMPARGFALLQALGSLRGRLQWRPAAWGRPAPSFAPAILVACALASGALFAQTQSGDTFTFFGVAQPRGPVTAGYLRMHHPLHLLDLCRQVQAGLLDRQKAEGFVGTNALDALLGMDLDALADRLNAELTGPHDPANPVDPNSLWYQILTDGGTAPLPPLDLPGVLDFQDVKALDFPKRVLHVTSPADGWLEARLPSGSPFQILSMRSAEGGILELPRGTACPGEERGPFPLRQTCLSPETARSQAPWMVPVRAGQDVDVTVGLPAGTPIPDGGILSLITFDDPVHGLWHQDVPLQAEPALPLENGIFLNVSTPKHTFYILTEPIYSPSIPYTFLIPLTLSTPQPPMTVQVTVKPLSLPQGVSVFPSSSTFTVQPQGSVTVWLTVSLDRTSQAWLVKNVVQPFSIQVSYVTVPVFAASSDVEQFDFIVFPSSQSWSASGSSGGVNCEQGVVLFSDGTLSRSGDCDNRNAYTAKVVSEGTLAVPKVVNDFYSMGWFDQDFKSSTVSWPYGQANYVTVRNQPLVMSWTKY